MKTIRNIVAAILILAFLLFATLPGQADDLSTQIEAALQTDPLPADEVPPVGAFYSASNPGLPPVPGNMKSLPAWNLGNNNWLLDDVDEDTGFHSMMGRSMSMDVPSPGDGGGFGGGGDYTNYPSGGTPIDTNGLYLAITNVSNSWSYLNLHNATNQVYSIWSTTNLATPFAGWNVEMELWPTLDQTNVMPFTVQNLERNPLFIHAEDWTGVDSDGDGIPDWWIWKYFGDLSETSTNLDSQGNTLGYDYTNSLDPDVISFTVSATNLYVNTTMVPLTINLQAGMPSYYAVLVNDTNYADAIWQPCTDTNIVVTLSSTDGDYNVWVGLRGLPADAQQTWNTDDLTFTLDRVAPLLTITSPAIGSNAVIKPYLHLQGFATKPVLSLSCDVSNALGVVSNLDGQVTDVAGYDATRFQYLTNYFQCYDLPLATNSNRITLRVTDLSGNTTTTNFNVTLDYSSATNPPTVSLIWPQDGMAVSGTNVTLRGTVSDETGTIQAQIVDEDGNTNVVQGLVERNNIFWIENVPLNGESEITLQATDAAGNMTTTNLTISPSDVVLTVDSTPSGNDLYQPSGTVNGTISDEGYDVWVNGLEVTNYWTDGDVWYWSADNVPIYGQGTATFDVMAYPPAEESLSRTMRTMTSSSTPPLNASVSVTMDAAVLISHYSFQEMQEANVSDVDELVGAIWHNIWTRTFDRQWQTNSNGQMQQTYQATDYFYHTYYGYSSTNLQSWSDPAPFNADSFIAADWDNHPVDGGWSDVHHNFAKGVHHHWDYGDGYFLDLTVGADTHWTLYTGGKASINRQSLFAINATGDSNGKSPSSLAAWGLFWYLTPITGLAASAIEVLGQPLGGDGLRWTVKPDNTPVDLNLHTPSQENTSVGVGQTKYASHFEVFVRQPYPEYYLPYPYNPYTPENPPPFGYPIYNRAAKDAGHAWWKLDNDAPTNIINQFTTTNCSQWLNKTAGYGPKSGATITTTWLAFPPTHSSLGAVYAGDDSQTAQGIYAIGFQGLGLIDGLNQTENLHANPGTWNSSSNNCVHAVIKTASSAGLGLPTQYSSAEFFGHYLPPNDP